MKRWTLFASLLLCLPMLAQNVPAPAKAVGILPAAEIQTVMPATVYFSGQVASVQLRNSFGVRWPDGKLTLFGLVDTGGYSSAVRGRYQFYVISDAAIDIAGKRLTPGAYGAGFLDAPGLLMMDLGGSELFHAPTVHDGSFKRPRPLQVVAGSHPGDFRLYLGRNYVTFRRP